jgi:GH18 family chitinase
MYISQHPVVPDIDRLVAISHVALAFMNSAIFNEPGRSEWPLFTTVEEVRSQFPPGVQVVVAIGGWGDTLGFSVAAFNQDSRRKFAENVARMVLATGADGVDIDWEYPG